MKDVIRLANLVSFIILINLMSRLLIGDHQVIELAVIFLLEVAFDFARNPCNLCHNFVDVRDVNFIRFLLP